MDKRDCCKEAWMAAVDSTDELMRSTIRDAMKDLSPTAFWIWLRGFIEEGK